VSHDRHFVSLVAESLWVVGEGTVTSFPGTFEEWVTVQQAEVEQISVREKPRPTRRRESDDSKPAENPQQRSSRPNPMREELMLRTISKLESRMAELETQLEASSQAQDLEDIARLGQEYDETEAELQRKL